MNKLLATLQCIKESETILNGEYYVIHSDFIIALEEEIIKLQTNIKLETINIDNKKLIEIIKNIKENNNGNS
jgi:hypothetical protein